MDKEHAPCHALRSISEALSWIYSNESCSTARFEPPREEKSNKLRRVCWAQLFRQNTPTLRPESMTYGKQPKLQFQARDALLLPTQRFIQLHRLSFIDEDFSVYRSISF